MAVLSCDSKDIERSAATWRHFGIHAVRGTASEEGARALVRMVRAVKDGWDFGITPDGPRGPRQVLKPGVVALARRTGAWIVPVTGIAEVVLKVQDPRLAAYSSECIAVPSPAPRDPGPPALAAFARGV